MHNEQVVSSPSLVFLSLWWRGGVHNEQVVSSAFSCFSHSGGVAVSTVSRLQSSQASILKVDTVRPNDNT